MLATICCLSGDFQIAVDNRGLVAFSIGVFTEIYHLETLKINEITVDYLQSRSWCGLSGTHGHISLTPIIN